MQRNAKGHPVLRPATANDVAEVRYAVSLLREARDLLVSADCPQAARKVRRALKSAEGAERHVLRRAAQWPEFGELTPAEAHEAIKRFGYIPRA